MSRDLPPRLRGSHCHLNAPTGGSPCGLAAPPRATTWSAGPPTGPVPVEVGASLQVVAPTGAAVQVTAPVGALATVDRPLAGGKAVANHLCRGSGRVQPPYFLAVFIAKM
ncbi:hypothetical protein GW17_00048067 [Ensete ventricosum]|nr:hypothetical protein GW17_00048067 [Ensete ventricosum]